MDVLSGNSLMDIQNNIVVVLLYIYINTCDKRYLKGKICMIGTSEVDDGNKRIKALSMINNAHNSFSEECKRLCEYSERENEAKDYSRYKKREAECKVTKILLCTE